MVFYLDQVYLSHSLLQVSEEHYDIHVHSWYIFSVSLEQRVHVPIVHIQFEKNGKYTMFSTTHATFFVEQHNGSTRDLSSLFLPTPDNNTNLLYARGASSILIHILSFLFLSRQ